ncbi:uncharacterized protein LOC113388527 [Ctenocephalides felis]|uniref:uncharacterized protein LOC113388527 n=1 Tax=Ctenocephalides felis TaxID=7515 RepID=UPI000E6E5907|nr:uncharacterized protein LOC113388527 [Ctenocephalides felis]
MPSGVMFCVCIPTANHEHVLLHGDRSPASLSGNRNQYASPVSNHQRHVSPTSGTRRQHQDAVNQRRRSLTDEGQVRVDVEIRDKRYNDPARRYANQKKQGSRNNLDKDVPMEKVLDELLKKLYVEHATWCSDKSGNYFEVFFPVAAGAPCENMLHCLTELGIGRTLNSVVNVMPCSVVYNGMRNNEVDDISSPVEGGGLWDNFVDSIRSKLTVKQVVDGVRSGGELSFDYILLIVTADSLAALGLVENNASNIVAAMLVSPLMGPVMSITFGSIISDRELMRVGFISLVLGMFISCVFGFFFGLILGTTEMPWGFGDWPTEEMKGRGNARSLWMGVLWALTSGTGVAVALLNGSAGPLIGVAISASLLPPVVNCGLYWALACIWLRYPGIRIPHIKGEPYFSNETAYEPLYSDYIPIEFAVNGVVSACLTIINVICIFITAIVVLKVKEVASPYTSSPELRRFWEKDIRVVRKTNRSTLRRPRTNLGQAKDESSFKGVPRVSMESAVEQALRQAVDDDTFRKVKRVSYSPLAAEEVLIGLTSKLATQLGLTSPDISSASGTGQGSGGALATPGALRNSTVNDLAALDKLITTLLQTQQQNRSTPMLNRIRPQSRSLRSNSSTTNSTGNSSGQLPTIPENLRRPGSWSERALKTLANAPHRLSASLRGDSNANDDEGDRLTMNAL